MGRFSENRPIGIFSIILLLLIATHSIMGYNAPHTTLATSHGFGTTTTVVVSVGGLKGVVVRNAFTEK